ncbi:hypothetical protein GYMLUDRAFT_53798 [Collybiopsis luxurians FD-317 M1]|nr:hypothetical protein GYMLUDRAFT_53798 [Collybiopsis luxurians FD-317 M1]
MPNTPMVIMWPNSDSTITISQRMAMSFSMPVVVPDPPRIATLSKEASTTSGNGRYVFTIPWDGSAQTKLVWAFGTENPQSSAVDAPFAFHLDAGHAQFDLSKPLSPTSSNDDVLQTSSTSTPLTTPTTKASTMTSTSSLPFTASQRMAFAHAVFCTAGFLFFLPAGALVSRWVRTFSPAWFTAHWILQFAAGKKPRVYVIFAIRDHLHSDLISIPAGPAVVIGVAFGVHSINNSRQVAHLNDEHKKWGVALFGLYVFQCALGAFIHWVKPKRSTGRPFQNYLHAVLGLIIVGLGFYQVRSGYKTEWLKAVGRGEIIEDADLFWYAWVVILPILYLTGLAFLPKQLRQEKITPKASPSSKGEQSSPLLAESSEVEPEEIGMQQIYRD